MQYTIPNYYRNFKCIAQSCPDTCCAGWQIVVDEHSLKKYKRFRGSFRRQLLAGTDFRRGVFRQKQKRCAFLNDQLLCDMYRYAGKQMLCDTCRKYPRHIEEFEGLRELSLSLSCPEAARLILEQQDPVSFLHFERNTKEEEYEDFDWFLFTVLMDARDYLITLLQNRSVPVYLRIQKALAYAHDLQTALKKEELYRADELLEQHRRSGFGPAFSQKYQKTISGQPSASALIPPMWDIWLPKMEVLNPDWPAYIGNQTDLLYQLPQKAYEDLLRKFHNAYPDWEVEIEQLMVYWVFTYFCGAVYDAEPLTKLKMAAVSTLFLQELDLARYLSQGYTFTKADQISICQRYSRELEHSDENLNNYGGFTLQASCFFFFKAAESI